MDIKPCPFCGYKAEVKREEHSDSGMRYAEYHVRCMNILCGAQTRPLLCDGYYGMFNTEIDAIVLWNKRAERL